jgi:MFS family permease
MKLSGLVIKSTIIAALGGLLFGFDTAVISGTTAQLTEQYHLSQGALGFTVASALWGTVLGAIFAGIPGQHYGRRDSLRVMAAFYVVSAPGVFLRSSSSALLAVLASAVPPCWAPCISRS